jgi:hypothetical protein
MDLTMFNSHFRPFSKNPYLRYKKIVSRQALGFHCLYCDDNKEHNNNLGEELPVNKQIQWNTMGTFKLSYSKGFWW